MTAIKDTYATFSDDPAAARTQPAVTATLSNGFARISGGPFNWDVDLPQPLGGSNQAPSPTAYFLGALAGCAVAFLNDTLAPEFGVQIDAATATAGCSTDLAGLVGVPGTDPRLRDLTLTVTVDSPSPAEDIEAMQTAWQQRCPIYLAIREPADVRLTFETRKRTT